MPLLMETESIVFQYQRYLRITIFLTEIYCMVTCDVREPINQSPYIDSLFPLFSKPEYATDKHQNFVLTRLVL